MSVSMEKVREKLEERRTGIKARLWDSLTDEQMTGIYRYAMEEQEKLLSASNDKNATKWDSLTDEQLKVIYQSLTKEQDRLLDYLEDMEAIEQLLQDGEWSHLPEEDKLNEE